MYRSPKEQIATMPELFTALGHMGEAVALLSSEGTAGEMSSTFSSAHEQLKRTPRKTFR
ncbi:hypothetical protein P9314_20815 [Paenibacillus validus]|uniref:Uncharacterized protein n=1 Tax=Paenibacillus validus TaxID=44253 RepID=A0A7X2Z7N5_9BACL|nr:MULTISPECIES: hypothetical protein [Paenibacillus]MED4603068.1 hypothetical protein [Paenibacillus validus]MED4608596.1 hypothetical protein [Paenibacillus validus]MUG69173.1 hypothetical protein [Paenibacillus validus]